MAGCVVAMRGVRPAHMGSIPKVRRFDSATSLASPTLEDKMTEADAEYHLGQVLMILASLHPDDQCDAYCNALAFYNSRHPEAEVLPEPGFTLHLRYDTPLSRALRDIWSPRTNPPHKPSQE